MDHYFDWGIKDEINRLIAIRRRNRIRRASVCRIIAAESDIYVAAIDERIVVKIGCRFEAAQFVPPSYALAASGKDYAVWERKI